MTMIRLALCLVGFAGIIAYAVVDTIPITILTFSIVALLLGELEAAQEEKRAGALERESKEDPKIAKLRDSFANDEITLKQFERGVEEVLNPRPKPDNIRFIKRSAFSNKQLELLRFIQESKPKPKNRKYY